MVTGSKRPTLQQVAAEAGVSAATASYALRGMDRGSSPETAERIRAVADRLGYRANSAARAVRTGRNGLVVVAVHRMFDPWAISTVEALASAAHRDGREVLVLPGPVRGEQWQDAIANLQPDIAYVEILDDNPSTRQALAELVERGQRLVVHSETMPAAGFDVIFSDPEPGAALVVDHLAAATDDVAFLTTEPHSRDDNSRARPYLRAVEEGRVRADGVHLYDGTRIGAFRAALALLEVPHRPKAVMCNTDFAALATIQAAHYLGLHVPGDILIAGLDNTAEGAHFAPALTSAGPVDFFDTQADIVAGVADGDRGEGRRHTFAWTLHARASSVPGAGKERTNE